MKSARTLTLILMLLAATVFVSAEERPYLHANIPFAFSVGNVDLPAGSYVVSLYPVSGAIRITETASGKSATIPTMRAQQLDASVQTKLVFHRVNGRYFLTQLWEVGNNDYRRLQPGKLERELAKGRTVENTTILANATPRNF